MKEGMKEWALLYAGLGFAVFPLRPRDKRPATEGGFKAATTDARQIAEWWDRCPGYNIGIATGAISGGLVVIDLDIDKDKGVDGYGTLRKWQEGHGALPETWQSITGRGGYHLFYKDAASNKSRAGLYEGIDVRADGGYVVAPPSVHPNGRRYEWEQGPGDGLEIAQADGRVAGFLLGDLPDRWAREGLKEPEEIPEGGRVDAMVRLIGSLRAKGLGSGAIRAAVEEENRLRCAPPLTAQELEREVFPSLGRDWKAERPYEAGPCTDTKNGIVVPRTFKPIRAVTAAELDKMDIPPIEWIVDKILPVGLALLGAPSKYYKSYMALGLCYAICGGEKFLGFDSNRNGCLYLDLESTKRRPKNRLGQISTPFKDMPDNLYIITAEDDVGRIGEGFEKQIASQMEQHPDIKLIVVDVFQMVRPPAKRSQTGYDRDYDDFRILKQIADKYDIGLMLIHHTRKMKDPSDVFNDLSGSTGVMGALDCAWTITKDDRYSDEGTLHITGRDMESQKLKIRFNKKTFRWEYVGTEEDVEMQRLQAEYEQSPIVETVKKLIKQNNGRWEGSASEIKAASKYLSWEIYDSPQKIGGLINKYEALFWCDGIGFEYKKGTKGKRIYKFYATNADNATNAEQLEIEDI